MSNPWAEVYKNLRSEILDESDLQERRKLRGDVKTTATQTRYDLKSRVAKMRAQGKTDLEIKQYLDKYIANSNLPGEQKAQIRQVALSAGYEPEGKEQLSENPLAVGAALGIGVGGAYLAKKAYNVAKQMRKNKEDAMKRASGESYDLEGNQLQEEPGDGYLGPARLKIKNPLASDATRAAGDQRRRQQTNAAVNSGQRPTLGGSGSYANQFDAMREKLRNSYEPEGEQIAEESERVLVRITTEDGRVFEKKVPREKISDLRKRYKTVVEVGSSEKAPTQINNKPGGVKEALDPVGQENADIDNDDDVDKTDKYLHNRRKAIGKAIKKKKVRSESLSDWRYEIQIDENQLGLTPKEMRSSTEEKKNEGEWESESELSEHNDINTWEESDRELANRLAEELGAEVLGVEVLDERIRIPKPSPRVVTQFMDKIDDAIPNLRLGREPAGAMVPVKPKPTSAPLTPLERAELERLQSTSIKDGNPNRSATLSTGRKIQNLAQVEIDPKTGAITSVKPEVKTGTLTPPKPPKPEEKTGTLTAPQTQTQTQTGSKTRTPIPPPPTRTGGRGPGPVPGPKPPISIPPIPIPFGLPALGEPKNVGKVVKV